MNWQSKQEMVEHNKPGTSTKSLWQSSARPPTDHSTSLIQTRCNHKEPILVGNNCSFTVEINSRTCKTTRYFLWSILKTRKVQTLWFHPQTDQLLKDGKLFTWTRLTKSQPQDSTKNLDSISIDHSTWFHDFQWKELLNVSVLLTLP